MLEQSSMTDQLESKATVISLAGYQGAGKSSLSVRLAELYKAQHVEISSVVKTIHGNLTRDELPGTSEMTKKDPNWLGRVIYGLVTESPKNITVISGVREPQVHKYLKRRGIDLRIFEIRCHWHTRYRRLLELGKVFYAEQFINHEIDEIVMGLRDVIRNAEFAVETTEDTDPKKLAFYMKEKLYKEGVR